MSDQEKKGGGWHFLWRRHPCHFSCLPLLLHPALHIPPKSCLSITNDSQTGSRARMREESSFLLFVLSLSFLCSCVLLKHSSSENQWDTSREITRPAKLLQYGNIRFGHEWLWCFYLNKSTHDEQNNMNGTLTMILLCQLPHPFPPIFLRPVSASAERLSAINHWKVFTRPQDI